MVDASLELYPIPYSMMKLLCLSEPKKKAGRLGSYAKPEKKNLLSIFELRIVYFIFRHGKPMTLQLSIYGDRSTSFPIAIGLCLDLPCAKSKGLVPMEIPLGLIPRLMTKGESAWRKVKIGGSREKFPSGVFRRSEGIQCPTTDSSRNCVIGAEPGMAVSGHPPSPVREALFNTLRKDVHRGQKDSVIGT
ncbi:hypothetical protein Tco_1415622 [Tanacetum coccineum]